MSLILMLVVYPDIIYQLTLKTVMLIEKDIS